MKQKIGLPDIINLVNYFKKTYLNTRLLQVYDVNSKCFLLKLSLENREKRFVIVDANVQSLRIHETHHEAVLPRQKLPSSFCTKLRIHLRNKKIISIRQLGMDRIIDIEFGFPDVETEDTFQESKQFHLILEMYDNGNLFLTDKDYKILILTRRHTFNENSKALVGHNYPMDQINPQVNIDETFIDDLEKFLSEFEFKKKKSYREILLSRNSPVAVFGKDIIIHCLTSISVSPNKKLTQERVRNSDKIDVKIFLQSLQETLDLINRSDSGFLVTKEDQPESYSPIVFSQYSGDVFTIIEHKTLSEVIDNYYRPNIKESIETKKKVKVEDQKTKVERIQESINEKLQKLQDQVDSTQKIIDYLETNQFIDEQFLVDVNKKDKIKIYHVDDMTIEIQYEINIWKNIKSYYQKKKDLVANIAKTTQSGSNAIENMKKQEKKQKKKVKFIDQETETKEFRFQKFKWFITSDGYLVILGKDMHQNEQLVSKHMTKNDIYIHSETHGSGSALIKDVIDRQDDSTKPEPSFKAVREAVCFVICNSKSWTSKIPSDGYWVYPEQVSKTPPSGEYISTGSFIVRGKRNYVKIDILNSVDEPL